MPGTGTGRFVNAQEKKDARDSNIARTATTDFVLATQGMSYKVLLESTRNLLNEVAPNVKQRIESDIIEAEKRSRTRIQKIGARILGL